MHRLVHIGFGFPGVPRIRDLEPAIGSIGDWVRYSALSWLVWTDKPMTQIYLILRASIDADDHFFAAEINTADAAGYLPPWIWSWIKSKGLNVVDGAPVQNALAQLISPPRPPSTLPFPIPPFPKR
jgi:hypothetical protein